MGGEVGATESVQYLAGLVGCEPDWSVIGRRNMDPAVIKLLTFAFEVGSQRYRARGAELIMDEVIGQGAAGDGDLSVAQEMVPLVADAATKEAALVEQFTPLVDDLVALGALRRRAEGGSP